LLPYAIAERSAEDHALVSDEQRRLLLALQALPRRQREVLTLRYFADLSEAEIADAMSISCGAVKSNAHKAMKALREQLRLEDQ
jgi:RNA polymerase sigma factor (sigma-70 family)